MKKAICIIITVIIIAVLCACAAKTNSDGGETATATFSTQQETPSERITSTTALNTDEARSGELLDAMNAYFESGNSTVEATGSFVYENNREPAAMYAYERDSEYEQQAKDNADAFIESIADFYPYEITSEDFVATQIGEGDNGIDSVRYEAYYTNSQNQTLIIYVDSDAVISYIDCSFTW